MAKSSEDIARRLRETEAQVKERKEILENLTHEVDERKKWLQDNEVHIGIGKAFLAFVACQGPATRDEILRYAERIVEACRSPLSVRDFRDRMIALSREFQATIFAKN